MKHTPELLYLLEKVERKYGRRISTSTDFEALSVVIEHEIGDMISSSTLKRLWGYVSSMPVPRLSTLDVLCKYLGHRDFGDFCEQIRKNPDSESSFFTSCHILSSELTPGMKCRLGWKPDRVVTLEYLGNCSYKVVESVNSQLQDGDYFCAACFMKGIQLYIPDIQRDGKSLGSYVAGSKEGLTLIEILQ